jgi:hypothetical protein
LKVGNPFSLSNRSGAGHILAWQDSLNLCRVMKNYCKCDKGI